MESTDLSKRKLGMWFNILTNFNGVETMCSYFGFVALDFLIINENLYSKKTLILAFKESQQW